MDKNKTTMKSQDEIENELADMEAIKWPSPAIISIIMLLRWVLNRG